MPPKKPSSKVINKAKDKLVEDKTFGLKNKKGKKQQDFIQQVQKQVDSRFNVKPAAKKKDVGDELEIFKPVLATPVQQKVSAGADPSSVLCAFFKAGSCGKGNKCKFSHDLSKERKSEKRSIYGEMDAAAQENDKMENWDQNKLQDVVTMKHSADNARKNQTDIVCKYFIEAIEKNLYGWFWNCVNGDKCMYKHALPPGFVLKKDAKLEEKEQISLEELIEVERANISKKGALTPVTLESFLAWKQRKLAAKAEAAKVEEKKKEEFVKAGRAVGLSGRDLFAYRPELFQDDEGAADDTSYARAVDPNYAEEKTNEEKNYSDHEDEEDGEGEGEEGEEDDEEEEDEDEGESSSSSTTTTTTTTTTATTTTTTTTTTTSGVPVDESLFDDDVVDDE